MLTSRLASAHLRVGAVLCTLDFYAPRAQADIYLLLRLDSPWGPYLLASMTLCYFIVFLYYMALGFHQLRSRPYHDVRTAVILYRLQVSKARGRSAHRVIAHQVNAWGVIMSHVKHAASASGSAAAAAMPVAVLLPICGPLA